MRNALLGVVLACVAAALGGCATGSNGPVQSGHLIVIGGAIEDDNARIYKRLMEYVGERGTILVVPTASADADGAIESKSKALAMYRTNQQILPLRITKETKYLAYDAATVEAINNASGLFFTGGVQSRIVDVFRPTDPETGEVVTTPAREAMFNLLRRGGVIAGTSAGAAMMSETMFITGNAQATYDWYSKLNAQQRAAMHQQFVGSGGFALGEKAGEDDEKGIAEVGPGMGFLQGAITDSHFIPRRRILRLWPMMEIAGETVGIGVSEDAAVDIDLANGDVEAMSKEGVAAAVLLVKDKSWVVTVMQNGAKAPKWKPGEVMIKAPLEMGEQVPLRVNELTGKK